MIYAIVGGIICALLATTFIIVRVQKGGMTALYLKALASVGFVGLGLVMFFDTPLPTGNLCLLYSDL